MSSNTSNVLFDDIFTINGIDKEGKKFDRGAGAAATFFYRTPTRSLLTSSSHALCLQSRACTRILKTTTWT